MDEKRAPSFVIFGYGGTTALASFDRLSQETSGYKMFAFDRQRVDVCSESQVFSILRYIRPDFVVNAASLADVEVCEMAKVGAFSVNAVGSRVVASACKEIGAKMIGFSTSCVFDGASKSPYTENCQPKPLNVYGKSKLQAEKDILTASSHNLIIRTGWLFSHEATNWLTEAVSMMLSDEPLYVMDKRVGCPTYAMDLADAMVRLLQVDACGIVNVVNEGSCSWSEFYLEVLKAYGSSLEPIPSRTKKNSFFSAKYPKNQVLATKKYSRLTGHKMRNWREALKDCLNRADKEDAGGKGRSKK